MADDITAQVTAWVSEELDKQRFGEDYAFAVTFGPAPMQTPQGVIPVPAWQLLITARSPLLGEGPMFHLVPIGAPRPEEASVRKQVAEGLRMLRDLAASKLAGQNGRGKQALPR